MNGSEPFGLSWYQREIHLLSVHVLKCILHFGLWYRYWEWRGELSPCPCYVYILWDDCKNTVEAYIIANLMNPKLIGYQLSVFVWHTIDAI
jgi:hypothetical protein